MNNFFFYCMISIYIKQNSQTQYEPFFFFYYMIPFLYKMSRIGKPKSQKVIRDCQGWGMATRSSVLAWRIPGMGEPGGLPSMGLHRIGHD